VSTYARGYGQRRWVSSAASAVFLFALFIVAALVAAVEPPAAAHLIVVGDIMLSRNVAARMKEAADPELPFRNVAAMLQSADLSFGNLESPLAPWDAGAPPYAKQTVWDGIIGGKSLIFGAPHASIQALRRYNFRTLGMANNHAMDQGEAGLLHTLAQLRANRIEVTGAGRNLEEAWRARVVELKGNRIGFLAASYASLNYGTDERNEYVARTQDLDRLRSAVRALKSQAAYIVVAMHAGDEYTSKPSADQVSFARTAIDWGANVVVGSHPHCLQPFEQYKQGFIFYSLGNFIFDLDASRATREGAAVKLSLAGGHLLEAEVIPVEIENACCPRAARSDEIPDVLRRMHLASTHVLGLH